MKIESDYEPFCWAPGEDSSTLYLSEDGADIGSICVEFHRDKYSVMTFMAEVLGRERKPFQSLADAQKYIAQAVADHYGVLASEAAALVRAVVEERDL